MLQGQIVTFALDQKKKIKDQKSLLEKMKISEVCYVTLCAGSVFSGWIN